MTWNKVVGYEEYYEVSDTGAIRSLDRYYIDSVGRRMFKKGHELKPSISEHGYARITLIKDGMPKTYQVHRIVADAFIPNINNYPFVNHKDENKLNNNVDNLEWCTSEYNANYGTRNKRMREKLRNTNCNGKPIVATLPDGTKEHYESARSAERALGYPHTGITNALKGRTHTACGRVWEYEGV